MLYTPPPTAAECAAFGITLQEATEGVFAEVWPDNQLAVNVFVDMMTQWRSAGFGATGLDYSALPIVLRMNGVAEDQESSVFQDVRVMEDAALNIMLQQRDSKRG